MRALLAEYTVAHDPALAPEGAAMLSVLKSSFERCGYEVITPDRGDFQEALARLAPHCEVGLVIAPDHLLSRFTAVMEKLTQNLGCGSMNVAVCANKRQTQGILSRHGIPVPEPAEEGKRVIKPVQGCGSQGVRISDGPATPGEISQRYIDGEHLSVSVVAGRIVGDACLYYSGAPPLVLAVNRQHIEIDREGFFHYLGGETPVRHSRHDEICSTAIKAVNVLGCQGYAGVDIVLSDLPYVVDVNPRITTSIVGISACMEEEIARVLVDASKGLVPGHVHLHGRVRFDSRGRVTPL